MHKLESYALSCASKISKPYIGKHFFPITSKKFICISQKSLEPSKSYDFLSDVVFHIKPYLDEYGISLVEISEKGTPPLFYCSPITGLNDLQASYIISKSLLYIGNLSLYTHIASHFKKPIVTPVNNDYIDLIKPYWGTEQRESYFLPETDLKPFFASRENPKTINEIKPEVLAKSVLDFLEIPNGLNSIETIFCGDLYNTNSIDVVPGQYDPTPFNLKSAVNIRLDKNFDLNFLYNFGGKFDSINLVSDQYVPIEILNPFKDKIKRLTIFVDDRLTHESLNKIYSLGIDIKLVCSLKNKINDYRLKFIDLPIDLYKNPTFKELGIPNDKNLNFLSKRNVLHEGKMYNSYLSIAEGKNVSKVKKSNSFNEDLIFCRIYKEKS